MDLAALTFGILTRTLKCPFTKSKSSVRVIMNPRVCVCQRSDLLRVAHDTEETKNDIKDRAISKLKWSDDGTSLIRSFPYPVTHSCWLLVFPILGGQARSSLWARQMVESRCGMWLLMLSRALTRMPLHSTTRCARQPQSHQQTRN